MASLSIATTPISTRCPCTCSHSCGNRDTGIVAVHLPQSAFVNAASTGTDHSVRRIGICSAVRNRRRSNGDEPCRAPSTRERLPLSKRFRYRRCIPVRNSCFALGRNEPRTWKPRRQPLTQRLPRAGLFDGSLIRSSSKTKMSEEPTSSTTSSMLPTPSISRHKARTHTPDYSTAA